MKKIEKNKRKKGDMSLFLVQYDPSFWHFPMYSKNHMKTWPVRIVIPFAGILEQPSNGGISFFIQQDDLRYEYQDNSSSLIIINGEHAAGERIASLRWLL